MQFESQHHTDIELKILKDNHKEFYKFIEQNEIVLKNIQLINGFLKKNNQKTDNHISLKFFIIFKLPFQICKHILDRMGLEKMYSQIEFQEFNQDDYYIHDEHIEQNNSFDINFWRNIFYFIRIISLQDIYRLNPNHVAVFYDFIQRINPIMRLLDECPMFYFLVSFLAGKNISHIIKQMNLSQNVSVQLKACLQEFMEHYIQTENQQKIADFIQDFMSIIVFEYIEKDQLMNEDYELKSNQQMVIDELNRGIRIYQFGISQMLPANVYEKFTENNQYVLQEEDVQNVAQSIKNVRQQQIKLNSKRFEQNKLINLGNDDYKMESSLLVSQNHTMNINYSHVNYSNIDHSKMENMREMSQYYQFQMNENEISQCVEQYYYNQYNQILDDSQSQQQEDRLLTESDLQNTIHFYLERNQGIINRKVIFGQNRFYFHKQSHDWKYAESNRQIEKNNTPFDIKDTFKSQSNGIDPDKIKIKVYNKYYEKEEKQQIKYDYGQITSDKKKLVLDDLVGVLQTEQVELKQNNDCDCYPDVIQSQWNGINNKQKTNKKRQSILEFLKPMSIVDEKINNKISKMNKKKQFNKNSNFKDGDLQKDRKQVKKGKLNDSIFDALHSMDAKTLFNVQQEYGSIDIRQQVQSDGKLQNSLSMLSSRLIASKASQL